MKLHALIYLQNKLLESRLKETSRKLEEERAKSEEKIRDLQSEVNIFSGFVSLFYSSIIK